MHYLTKRLMSLIALSIISITPVALAEDMTVNRLLASQCAQCHGSYGYAVGDIDSLTGESTNEIIEELMEMQNEGSPDDIMDHQALGYTEDQIRRIATYYNTIPESAGSGSGSGSDSDSDNEQDHEGKENKKERKKKKERKERKERRERKKRKDKEEEKDD